MAERKAITGDVAVAAYVERHSSGGDAALAAIERWANLHTAQPQMICGPYEGALLTMLCRMAGAVTVVEIGTFVGYSTVCLARGVADGGKVYTFEINDELEGVIHKHLRQAGVEERVELNIGDAMTLVPDVVRRVGRCVDVAFIDADKRRVGEYYEMMIPLMRRGGVIVVDNVLWGGKVLEERWAGDRDTMTADAFNRMVCDDPRVENVMLDVRDGVMICSVL